MSIDNCQKGQPARAAPFLLIKFKSIDKNTIFVHAKLTFLL